MIISQIKALSKMKPLQLVNLVLSIAAMLCFIRFVVPAIFFAGETDSSVLFEETGAIAQFSFMLIMVEVALLIYVILTLAEKFFIWIFKKIKGSNDFIKNELDNENADDDPEKITVKRAVSGIAILLGIFLVVNGILFYAFAFDSTVVTTTQITEKSVFNPVGSSYSYNDIKSVEVREEDLCPLYIMHMADGHKVELVGSYIDDIYEVDLIVKSHNIPKKISCEKSDINYTEEEEKHLEEILS